MLTLPQALCAGRDEDRTLEPRKLQVREHGETWAVARESSPGSPFWVVAHHDGSDPRVVRWTVEDNSHGGAGEDPSGSAGATYVCVNRGGANPSAQNKTTVAGPVSATGTFNSGKNGQVTASLTVNPPPSDISCPPGQSLELASVSYTNVLLTDTTNNVSITVGDVSSGCLLPNVRGAC